jgi:hypothetical protein
MAVNNPFDNEECCMDRRIFVAWAKLGMIPITGTYMW